MKRGVKKVATQVSLRKPTARDRDELLALRRASRAFLRPWEPRFAGIDPCGDEWFDGYLKGARSKSNARFLVCRREDGAIVGGANLSQIFHGPLCSAYLGYWTGAPYVRLGYATAGVQLVLRRAFRELGLHRVEANIIPTNTHSIAVVQRLGFRKEGLARRYLKIAGRWRDHERWALLRDDFKRR